MLERETFQDYKQNIVVRKDPNASKYTMKRLFVNRMQTFENGSLNVHLNPICGFQARNYLLRNTMELVNKTKRNRSMTDK